MVISISAALLGVAKIVFFIIFAMFWWFCCFYTDCPRNRTEDAISWIMFVVGIATIVAFLIYTGEVVDFVTAIKFVA